MLQKIVTSDLKIHISWIRTCSTKYIRSVPHKGKSLLYIVCFIVYKKYCNALSHIFPPKLEAKSTSNGSMMNILTKLSSQAKEKLTQGQEYCCVLAIQHCNEGSTSRN